MAVAIEVKIITILLFSSYRAALNVTFSDFRMEYDAYRVDLEELNLGPRDAITMPKLELAQKDFQSQREKYQSVRDGLSVKVKLLQENKVRRFRSECDLVTVVSVNF